MAATGHPSFDPAIPPRTGWNAHLVTLVALVAVLPVGIAAFVERGAGWLMLLGVSIVTVLVWQVLFALIRKRPVPDHGLVVALTFCAVLPADVSIWQAALALSFGVVAGEQIFGGRGYSFLHPAVVALAFLIFSFPGTSDGFGEWSAMAVVPGALLLLGTGFLNWRVVVAAAAALVVVGYTGGHPDAVGQLATPAFAFGLVFFAGDPVTSSATNVGRWVHGALFGILVALLSKAAGTVLVQPVVFAALLSSVFAPMIDQGVIWGNQAQRRRRHG